jgi:hypothetical protein
MSNHATIKISTTIITVVIAPSLSNVHHKATRATIVDAQLIRRPNASSIRAIVANTRGTTTARAARTMNASTANVVDDKK